jgi:hypothetical protein
MQEKTARLIGELAKAAASVTRPRRSRLVRLHNQAGRRAVRRLMGERGGNSQPPYRYGRTFNEGPVNEQQTDFEDEETRQ